MTEEEKRRKRSEFPGAGNYLPPANARALALTEMRERCAKAAEEFMGPYDYRPNRQFAAAIRALPLEP